MGSQRRECRGNRGGESEALKRVLGGRRVGYCLQSARRFGSTCEENLSTHELCACRANSATISHSSATGPSTLLSAEFIEIPCLSQVSCVELLPELFMIRRTSQLVYGFRECGAGKPSCRVPLAMLR